MSSPLEMLPWAECLLTPRRDRQVEAYLRQEAGRAPGWSRYFSASPWLAKAAIRLGNETGMLLRLESDLANLVALVVSQENSCRYCYAAARAMMRMFGVNEERMRELERRLAQFDFDPRTTAALRFARLMNRGYPLSGDAERAALRNAGFDDDEIRELAYVVAIVGFMNRLSTAPALPPRQWETLPDHPLVRLLRPVIARVLKREMKSAAPAVGEIPQTVLAPRLVEIYRGSPIARVLGESLNDLWLADGLERRIKLLMLAIIAQGIDCAPCRLETEQLASAEGLDPAAYTAIVAHLDGPDLDGHERALLMFARESLWYEAPKLQRLSRELFALLGERQFLEALAVVTLANAYTRLTAVMVPAQ